MAESVLVIGGSGFIGRRLSRRLVEEGCRVLALGLSRDGLPPSVEFVSGDRHDPVVLRQLARRDHAVVVDLIAYRSEDTRLLLEAFGGRAGRLIHLSTLSVFAAAPCPILTEENGIRHSGRGSSYGHGKAGCECLIEETSQAAGLSCVILRSAPLIGREDPVSRENFFAKRLLAGLPVFVPGSGEAHVSLLFVDDLVDVLTYAVVHTVGDGRAYNLAQRERLTLGRHIQSIAETLGVPCRMKSLAPEAYEASGLNLFGYPYAPLEYQAWLDTSRAQAELDFRSTPYPEALREAVGWLREDGPWSRPAWPGWNSTQAGLAGTHEWIFSHCETLLESRSASHDPDQAPKPRYPDELLSVLTGLSNDAVVMGREEAVAARRWLDPATVETSSPPAVVLAEGFEARIGEPGPLPGTGGTGLLEGVMEWATKETTAGLFYNRHQSGLAWGYGPHNTPLTFRFCPFSELELEALHLSEGERLLTGLVNRRDVAQFLAWAGQCEERGAIDITDFATCCRIVFVRACRWTCLSDRGRAEPPERGAFCLCRDEGPGRCRHVPESIAPEYRRLHGWDGGKWSRLFDLCRILRGAGAADRDIQCVEWSSPRRRLLLPGASPASPSTGARLWNADPQESLLRLGQRYFACRLAPREVFELTEPLALFREMVERGLCQDDAVALAGRLYKASPEQAREAFEAGLAMLAERGLVTRAPAG